MVRTEDDPLSFLDSDTASAAILRPGPSRGAGPHHPAGRPRAPPPRASVVTTPLNVVRQRGVAEQAAGAGLLLEFVELPFPPADSSLPPDFQNADMLAQQ